jgi:hypothetical protein
MPSPSLKIPVSVDLAGFKKAMSETSSLAGTAKKSILKQFSDLNAELGGPMLAT